MALLNDDSVELLHVHDVDNSMIPFYLNAADLLLLTSVREGVNVIKEAMACNCPFVATDVGDIREVAVRPKDAILQINQAARLP